MTTFRKNIILSFSGHKIESSWKKEKAIKKQKTGSQAVGFMAFEMNVLSMGEHEQKGEIQVHTALKGNNKESKPICDIHPHSIMAYLVETT
jgi:hypothetical protein